MDDLAQEHGVLVGMETEIDYDLPGALKLKNVGFTIDVGHQCISNGFRGYGSLGNLLRTLHRHMLHMHIHDYDGKNDHLPLGQGKIDFPDIIQGLKDIDFGGVLCLELNPDRATPQDIVQSRKCLLDLIG